MIQSIVQIDFIDAVSGASTRLLSIGDKSNDTLSFGFSQESTGWSPVGADYGFAAATGGSRQPIEFQRIIDHASHAVAAAYAIKHPASIPKQRAGKLRITISGGEVWDHGNAVILAVTSRARVGYGFRTLTAYNCEAGEPLPVSGLTHAAGVRVEWILETHSALAALHSAA